MSAQNNNTITLNKENCIDLLMKYIDAGYKNTGIVTIKEAGVISKYFRMLKGQEEKPEDVKVENIYKVIFNVIVVLNANKAFTLNDGSVLDSIITYVEENVLKTPETEKPKEPEPKIKEL